MGDTWHALPRLGQPEIRLRERDRIALRIVDAHLAVLEVAALGDHRAVRIARAVAREDRLDVTDRDAEMVQAVLHAQLAQAWPLSEEREVESAVRERRVA